MWQEANNIEHVDTQEKKSGIECISNTGYWNNLDINQHSQKKKISIKIFRIIPHLSISLLCHDCQGSVQRFLLLQKNWVWTKFLTNLKHLDLHAQSTRSLSYFLHQWRYVKIQALTEGKDHTMPLLLMEEQKHSIVKRRLCFPQQRCILFGGKEAKKNY